ncbi:MAG: NRDE family protein [Burkholderiales bacterium]
MCLAVIALDAHPRFSLVLAANRDEFHARAAVPAAWGDAPPFAGILAGRDLVAGGTWLGVRRDGRWAFVTNVREGGVRDMTRASRGEIVPRMLGADVDVHATLAAVAADGERYNGFNLVAGDADAAAWMSNRTAQHRDLDRGVHGLSNAFLDTPWPKVVRTRERVLAWCAGGSADLSPLFAALADRTQAADDALPDTGVTREWERTLSSPFIVGERYGTRCSTIFAIDRDGRARFVERRFAPDGTVSGEVDEAFAIVPGARC